MRIALLLAAALLSACQASLPALPAWQSPEGLQHPELGQIVELRTGARLTPEQLLTRLSAAPKVLVGERHDNPDHHALQLWLLRALAAQRPQGSLLLEMLTPDQQVKVGHVRTAIAAGQAPQDILGALNWQPGWAWSLYGPLVQHALRHTGVRIMALVPNLRGAQAALQAGAQKLTMPVSASPAHSMANVRKTPEAMVEEVKAVLHLRNEIAPDVPVEIGMSTAFGCTLQGAVPEDDVLRLALLLAEAGVDEIGLSDTTGMGNPAQVTRLFKRLFQEIGPLTGSAHMHNTRGLGLANCLAAYEAGVRTFDSSLGGLGGCPYAPGASGNVVTEDLVFMFEAMGVGTGIDLEKLMAARLPLQAGLPGEPIYGMTPEAGLPKGWRGH